MAETPVMVSHERLREFIVAVLQAFKAAMDDMLRALKESPRAAGHARIYTAGEPEVECERQRLADGIPLAPPLARQLGEIAASLGVPPLSP